MDLVERKRNRMKTWDYSRNGMYFITICVEQKRKLLSTVVGQGFAPTENKLTQYGKISERILLELPNRYLNIKIDKYVVMPNHIHLILSIQKETVGASPHLTVPEIICAYKSLVTRECKSVGYKEQKLFQRSFHDHIIRNEQDYQNIWTYIDNNPLKWELDCYYA